MTYPTGGMSAEEFEAELQRRFGYRVPKKTAVADFGDDPLSALTDKRTVAELLPDYFAAQIEDRPWRQWHPLLRPVLSDRLSLSDIETRSGLSRSDFGNTMTSGIAELLGQRWKDLTGDFDKISKTIPLDDYRATNFGSFVIAEPVEVAEGADIPQAKAVVTEAARQGRLRQFGAKFQFSRAAFMTWGENLAQQIVDFATVFSQTEWRVVAETLEAGTITTSASSALTVAGFQSVASTMRNSLNGAGGKTNLPVSAIVVPEQLEGTALVLREALGQPFDVLVNCHLTSATTWYALTDPKLSAPLLRLRLRGNSAPRLYSNFDDLMKVEFALTHDFDYVLSGAPGLIKATA